MNRKTASQPARIQISVILVWVCLHLSGCLFLALPIPESDKISGRKSIAKEDLEFLVNGETTREDILLRFGEPDLSSIHESTFVYQWDVARGVYFWVVGGGYSAAGDAGIIPKTYLVMMEFNEDGILARWVIEEQVFRNRDKIINEWAEDPFPEKRKQIILSPAFAPYPVFDVAENPVRIKVLTFEDERIDGSMDATSIGFHEILNGSILFADPHAGLPKYINVPLQQSIRWAIIDQLSAMGHLVVDEDPAYIMSGNLVSIDSHVRDIKEGMLFQELVTETRIVLDLEVSGPGPDEAKKEFHYSADDVRKLDQYRYIDFNYMVVEYEQGFEFCMSELLRQFVNDMNDLL